LVLRPPGAGLKLQIRTWCSGESSSNVGLRPLALPRRASSSSGRALLCAVSASLLSLRCAVLPSSSEDESRFARRSMFFRRGLELGLAGAIRNSLARRPTCKLREHPAIAGCGSQRLIPIPLPLSIDAVYTGVFPADKTDPQPLDRIPSVYYQVSHHSFTRFLFATLGTSCSGREFTWRDDKRRTTKGHFVNVAICKTRVAYRTPSANASSARPVAGLAIPRSASAFW